MRSNPMITISPMQAKLFSQSNRLATPKLPGSQLSAHQIPNLESSLSKTSSAYFNNGYNSHLSLSNMGSQVSNISNQSKNSSASSNKSSIRNSYIHTEYDASLKRVKSTFMDKPIPIETGIYTGNRFQSVPNQDNYKRKFYNNSGQLNQGVVYNKYFGANNLEIEEYEDTVAPFHYFKVSTRNNEIISTSTMRPHQISQMISSDQYLPTN